MPATAADLVLCAILVTLAVGVTWAGARLRAVALYTVLGLLVAVAWVRLGALDVALAEAAVGAGITGVLLLLAARDLERYDYVPPPPGSGWSRAILGLFAAAAAGGLAWAVSGMAGRPAPLVAAVAARLEETGVQNPVTAVLLDFRSWDTLLEVAVLLAAVAAVGHLGPELHLTGTPPGDPGLAAALTRAVVPTAVILGGYLLWAGAHAPGGAFQAGAVLAAAGLLLVLTGSVSPSHQDGPGLRLAATAGLLVFVGAAVGVLPFTGSVLDYPAPAAKHLILAIEIAVTVSVAVGLLLIVVGARGLRRKRP